MCERCIDTCKDSSLPLRIAPLKEILLRFDDGIGCLLNRVRMRCQSLLYILENFFVKLKQNLFRRGLCCLRDFTGDLAKQAEYSPLGA